VQSGLGRCAFPSPVPANAAALDRPPCAAMYIPAASHTCSHMTREKSAWATCCASSRPASFCSAAASASLAPWRTLPRAGCGSCPQFQAASCRALTNVHNCITDYCGFGTPWRKRTALMSVHLDLRSCVRRCTGKGTCSFSCKKHVQLVGQHNGQFLTRVAEPYPAGLCRSICQCFVYALKQHQLNALERLL